MLIENPVLSSFKDSLRKVLNGYANIAVTDKPWKASSLGEYRNLLCCVMALLCLGIVHLFFLCPVLEQNQAVTEKINKLQREQQELSGFAREHNNFAAFREERLQEISRKAGTLSKDISINDYLSRLSKLSGEQNIRLESVRISGKALPVPWNKGLLYEQLDLHLQGDFYSIVRFLRKLERDAVSITDFRVKGNGNNGGLDCKFRIHIYRLNN